MKVKALVAVRSGSVRVKNKNLRPFAGSSLLEVKVKQLMRIPNLDGVVVNSDDDQMLRIAKGLGCETVKRDPHYASNQVSMSEVYAYMAAQMEADVIAYINVTNPLLRDATLIDAIEKYKELAEEGTCDSLNSAHLVKEFLFFENQPINYDLKYQPRSQDLPGHCRVEFRGQYHFQGEDDLREECGGTASLHLPDRRGGGHRYRQSHRLRFRRVCVSETAERG